VESGKLIFEGDRITVYGSMDGDKVVYKVVHATQIPMNIDDAQKYVKSVDRALWAVKALDLFVRRILK
jgi:hypothetical protein